MTDRTRYCVGFAFDEKGRLALIRKSRPAWQRGKLNGIGGHVEDGERFVEAMAREFMEEAGPWLPPSHWKKFLDLVGKDWHVRFFVARQAPLDLVESQTDEEIVVRDVASPYVLIDVLRESVPNLAWLIPMAQQADRLEGEIRDGDPRELRR